MLRKKFIAIMAILAVLGVGYQTSVKAVDHTKKKKEATFKVRIENISAAEGLAAADGTRYPFALSPGFYILTNDDMDLFKAGKRANDALEAQAEDGNPELFVKKFLTKVGSINVGAFTRPVGSDAAAPILPNGAYEFTFNASEGMKLNLITMFGQSNDLFYAPESAIDLFPNGDALNGDITGMFQLWDAGTEVNQAPGIGADQAPRQKAKNTGSAEGHQVGMVKDGFTYPNTKDVFRVTITAM